MILPLALVLAGVLWVITAFTWVARRDAVAHARRFEGLVSLEEFPADGVAPGALMAFRGPVSSKEAMPDPASDGERAVFLELRVDRLDPAGRKTVAHRVERGELHVSGVAVPLEGAQIDLPLEELSEVEGGPSPTMRALMPTADDRDERPPPTGTRHVLLRRRIALGDVLTVVGASADGSPRLSAVAGPLRLSPAPLREVVADERAAIRGMNRMLGLSLGLAAVFTVGALAVLAALLGASV